MSIVENGDKNKDNAGKQDIYIPSHFVKGKF